MIARALKKKSHLILAFQKKMLDANKRIIIPGESREKGTDLFFMP
jgi:hypothetical protein